ncbi:(2Fe-2S)-binding protein [Leptolyngbya sp. 'hensonii']|uniref:aromatic ring-hydroxylating dioxygenase subunit alpha n=1 Tax=Leptolyngbya sp. 'hensonii' TaxID=1922337 RepID=UPI00094FE6EA|nr:aromatic ring-hydroxylating dioxygenase subunit alpha [Leptolyngbya sp. 'hensonii']OLP19403.1 (2Fe-2S)-binding protein [Leptolyngbya sp. 'hensonii']
MSFTSNRQVKVFNHPDCFIPGWYWALPSRQLRVGQVKPVTLQGRDLALYRGRDGRAIAVDAYCPHMGAHLAEGRVEEDGLRCFFHNWKFNTQGHCIEMPGVEPLIPLQIQTWPTAEHYGLIWVWTGTTPSSPPPTVPELEQADCDVRLGAHFYKNCHPNVVMINAIDAHHFNTVHNLPLEIHFVKQDRQDKAILFSNTTRGGQDSWLIRLIQPLYKQEGTYSLCYWYGSTGTVTLGPDCLHFYILFTLRMLPEGKTEGQTVLITPKRSGVAGWLLNRLILQVTQWVGNYFARGDTRIFQTIQFDFQTPTKADQSIIQFIQHLEQQPAIAWKTWVPLAVVPTPGELALSSQSMPEVIGCNLQD